jgi:hypothetical protein
MSHGKTEAKMATPCRCMKISSFYMDTIKVDQRVRDHFITKEISIGELCFYQVN